jgi:adenine deaminase
MKRDELIAAARGDRAVDLVLRNAGVVNVFAGDVEQTDVAIAGGLIVGLGHDYHGACEVDLQGRYLAPGFMDGHMHVESSMVPIPEFARAVVPQGTTTIIIDPHEIANVHGIDGIRFMLDSSSEAPLGVFVMLPSAVPASPMETAGAILRAADLAPLLSDPRVLGIGEMMNFPGVVGGDPAVLDILEIAGERPIDGHAPGLRGMALNAYIAAGVGSDHECTTLAEAEERLRRGMYVMIREASNAQNLAALAPLVTQAASRRCLLVTDDRTPADLLDEGHINFLVRKAIGLGIDPVTAIQMVTLNVAECFGLPRRGAVAPGYLADLVVLDQLSADFVVERVYRGGELVAEHGKLVAPVGSPPRPLPNSMNLRPLRLRDFRLPAGAGQARIIRLVPDQIVTRQHLDHPAIEGDVVIADTARDILKLAVVERHHASGQVGLGLVQGFGLGRGALASSVAHDSHNIVVVGTNDADMLSAVEAVIAMGGGQAVVVGGEVLAGIPLPLAGLMSDQPVEVVRGQMNRVNAAAHDLGCTLHAPFMALSFLALPVIPELKLTDQGLVDVTSFATVPVFVES